MDTTSQKALDWGLWVALVRDLVPLHVLKTYGIIFPLKKAPKADLVVSANGLDGFVVEDSKGAIVKSFERTREKEFDFETRELNAAANSYAETVGKVWESFGGASRFDPAAKRWYCERVHGDPIPLDWDAISEESLPSPYVP